MERLLTAPSLYVFGGAALVIALTLWPVPVRVVGHVDVFGLDLHLALTMLFGRFAVRTVRTEDGQVDAAIELSVFHVFTIRKHVVSEPPEPAGQQEQARQEEPASDRSDTDVAGDNFLGVLRNAWRRWRPVVRGVRKGAQFVLRRVQVQQLRFRGEVGIEDPAWTAQAYGAVWTIVGMAGVWMQKRMTLKRRPHIELVPAYNVWRLRFTGEGTMSVRLADAFLGGAVALWELVRERLTKDERESASEREGQEVDGGVGEAASG